MMMASNPAAILAGAKAIRGAAIPGAASPTMPPQGANIGQISPLAASLANERGYANTYGPFLQRPPRTFTSGAFGPFSPILPVPVDEPDEGAQLPDPRLFEYLVGWNLPVGRPGTEGIKLADFSTLKTLADLYSVARAAIQIRKNEIVGLDWEIAPTKDAAKAYHGDKSAMKDFGGRRGQVMKFFRRPDPDYFSFGTWLSSLLEEVFVYDALSLIIRPKRGKNLGRGILGSNLDCIELISGPTIRPLLGMHGEVPRPPAPAYQQYLYGVPRSDYMTMITERDLERAEIDPSDTFREFTTDQLLYLPMVPRRWTPYGFPPIERALIPVMSGLQKQAFQLDYFREGTIPAVYISPGDVNMTPNQIRELQDALNAFAGDPAWHHKVIVLPPGSRVDPQKPTDVADQFDEIVMTQVVQAFDVNPMELGIIPKVSTVASPFAAREMAQTQRTIHERISTKPMLKFLCDIFNGIIQNYLGQHDMKFTFEGLQEEGEQGALTDLLVKQVQSGIRSVDEARDILELQPWNIPLTSGPIVMTAAGPVPFGMIMGKPGGSGGHSPGGDQGGAPTPSLVPVQQTGHQNGEQPATPGHAAATAALAGSRTAITQPTAGPPSGSVSSVKVIIPAAVKSELEALQRHLRKGRLITSWEPKHIPPRILSLMAENIARGLPVEQAIAVAKTIVLGPEAEGTDAIQIAG